MGKLAARQIVILLDHLPNDVILPIRKIAFPLDEKSERIAIYCEAKYSCHVTKFLISHVIYHGV